MNYLVNLKLQLGAYEKTSRTLITNAKTPEEAERMALALECHGDATWDNKKTKKVVYDVFGEMAYSVHDSIKVSASDLVVMKKFMNTFQYDASYIKRVIK